MRPEELIVPGVVIDLSERGFESAHRHERVGGLRRGMAIDDFRTEFDRLAECGGVLGAMHRLVLYTTALVAGLRDADSRERTPQDAKPRVNIHG